jgi:hypothetical protein
MAATSSAPFTVPRAYADALFKELGGKHARKADVTVDEEGSINILLTSDKCTGIIDVFIDTEGSVCMDGMLLFPPPVLKPVASSRGTKTKLRCWRTTDFRYTPSADAGAKIGAIAALIRLGFRDHWMQERLAF